MNFLNIKYFMAIAEEQSISAAARKLFVSQQSLSEHLKKMESELGVPLFERGTPLRMTVAGECFYDSGKELITDYNQMLSNIDNVTVARRSKITVGIATYGEPPFLAELLMRFRDNYPQYDIVIKKRQHSDIEHFMNGIDLYISYQPLPLELEHTLLIKDNPYCVIFQKELALQTYQSRWPEIESSLLQSQDLSLLKDMPFLILKDRHDQIARDMNQIFEEHKFSPKASFNSESLNLLSDLCIQGGGCLVSTASYIHFRFGPQANTCVDLLSYPIKANSFPHPLAICYEKGRRLHAAELAFIKHASTFFSS